MIEPVFRIVFEKVNRHLHLFVVSVLFLIVSCSVSREYAFSSKASAESNKFSDSEWVSEDRGLVLSFKHDDLDTVTLMSKAYDKEFYGSCQVSNNNIYFYGKDNQGQFEFSIDNNDYVLDYGIAVNDTTLCVYIVHDSSTIECMFYHDSSF